MKLIKNKIWMLFAFALVFTACHDFPVDEDGLLNMPAVGMNYFFKGCNLKLQAMYQYIGRTGHATELDRDNDDLGLAMHSGTILLQYTF